MHNIIAWFFDRAFPPLGLRRRESPVRVPAPQSGFPPAAHGPRQSALPADMVPQPPTGPYSQAAYERWKRAEDRMRRERQCALRLAMHGVDAAPYVIRDVGAAAVDFTLPQCADYPVHRSPVTFPPCDCGAPVCPDRRTPPDPDESSHARPAPRPDSPLLLGLRSRIREENQFRAWFRELG